MKAIWIGAAVVLWSLAAQALESLPPNIAAQVAAGRQVFETTCASSMCHGSGGVGAEGPGLENTGLTLDAIRTVIQKGRPGTAMSPFGELLDPEMQAQVMAFVLSISSGGDQPKQIVEMSAPRLDAAPSLADMPDSVTIGAHTGRPLRGYEVFYDTTRITGCRACHRVNGNGAPLGPDLADLSTTPLEMYGALTTAKLASSRFPAVEIEAVDGAHHVGLKESETGKDIRYFDVTSALPVLRTLPLDSIESISDLETGLFDHTTLDYDDQALLDLAAFIYASRR